MMSYVLLITEADVPSTYRETAQSSESNLWERAMLEEMGLLIRTRPRTYHLTAGQEGDWLQVGLREEGRIFK